MAARNEELEILRASVLPPPALEPIVEDIYKTAQWVHIGFIFEPDPSWEKILIKVVKGVTGIKNAWRKLGYYLGLPSDQLKSIEDMGRKKDEVETYFILRACSDIPDVTFGHLLKALLKAELLTVIQETHENIREMTNSIVKDSSVQDEIIKSNFNRSMKLPVCLRNIDNLENINLSKDESKSNADESEYSQVVLVSYADDGVEIVQKIRDLFVNSYPKVGVLTLEKNSNVVHENSGIVTKWCEEVNYIIPVITPNYLKTVLRKTEEHVDFKYLDQKHAQVIYEWFRLNYINKGCLNRKIRCVLPDGFNRSKEWLENVNNLCFQTWFSEENLKTLYDRIVDNCDALESYIPRELSEDNISCTSNSTTNLTNENLDNKKKKKKFASLVNVFTIKRKRRQDSCNG